MTMVSKRHALVARDRCVACGACMKECPRQAVSVFCGSWAEIDIKACIGCGRCAKVCPADCVTLTERRPA